LILQTAPVVLVETTAVIFAINLPKSPLSTSSASYHYQQDTVKKKRCMDQRLAPVRSKRHCDPCVKYYCLLRKGKERKTPSFCGYYRT
jgi:hypothetical protein